MSHLRLKKNPRIKKKLKNSKDLVDVYWKRAKKGVVLLRLEYQNMKFGRP